MFGDDVGVGWGEENGGLGDGVGGVFECERGEKEFGEGRTM